MSNLSLTQYFEQKGVVSRFNKMLGDRAQSFMTSVLQVVSNNDLLKKASSESIYNAAATAATLDLPINNNLGFAYIVPYKGQAQFQIGYKGLIQLAQRTGLYKRISVAVVYDGQLVKNNPLLGPEFDWDIRRSDDVIGYAAYFSLLTGFEATLFLTKKEVEAHAKKYSKSYGKDTSAWTTNFDGMAKKTVLKLLLSRFGPLSIKLQEAIIADQGIVSDSDNIIDGKVTYPDNESAQDNEKSREESRVLKVIESCDSVEKLDSLKSQVETKYLGKIESRRSELLAKGTKNV